MTTETLNPPLRTRGAIEASKTLSIHLTIGGDIRIPLNSIPQPLLEIITADLTLDNPAYASAVRMGRYTGNIPQRLTMWALEEGILTVPRGYGQTLLKRCRTLGIQFVTDDRRLTLPPVTFESRIKLRPYQVLAVERLVQMLAGGLVAPCGSGKTTAGLKAIADVGQPALVIVATLELALQWIDRATQFLGIPREEIGLIGNGKRTIGTRLTVGLVQTLSKMDLTEIRERFGLVILDEAHHAPASTFQRVFAAFPAIYRLWLSATPERQDGLHPILYAVGGPILHTISRADLPTVTPVLRVIETDFTDCDDDYSALLTRLTQDERRNRLIVDAIAQNALGHYSLVLSERVDHLEVLHKMLADISPNLRAATLTGRMSKREREQTMAAIQAREIDVLFSTQLAREGLDIVHLDQLFMTCPKRAASAVEQEIGRIMRPAEGKAGATVWDFWDSGSPMPRGQFWRRRDVYRKLGMEVSV